LAFQLHKFNAGIAWGRFTPQSQQEEIISVQGATSLVQLQELPAFYKTTAESAERWLFSTLIGTNDFSP